MIQQIVGWPSIQAQKEAIEKNQIRKFSITIDYINGAEAIYEPHIPIIPGKAIRRSP